MQSGSGIQELMAAETRASQIVAEARIGQSFPSRGDPGRGDPSGAQSGPERRQGIGYALARRAKLGVHRRRPRDKFMGL